ncbi:unnamed protein product [Acanthoscelides obtectus]|uniref:Meiosis-specific with OB domain-containing protein n=1 Tax=Acanthoscelides obtectus TaxID=200917 RepID=A0A9P0LFC8_ACAOB|nr:unnamed protein product [Acanthoscelides obtectus]CAK1659584.1 Meiosis-specific with OB domain-containing protein [Acanthoscelides obtectus]
MATNTLSVHDNNNNISLRRVKLRELLPDIEGILIIGIIIGKQRPRKFLDRKSPVESYIAVWNFTLRDSPCEYINVSFWGSTEVVFQANDKFHTGDVVEIINPKIRLRSLNDQGEQYRPMVTSPYSMQLNERSYLVLHEGPVDGYRKLLQLPTKPLAGYVAIKDVHSRGACIKDLKVDILVVVKSLGTIRTVKARTSETLQVRTVEVFDQTSTSMKIEVWESDIIARSEKWKPRCTILFLTDLRVQWSDFQREFVTKVTSSTIVTENPIGREAQILLDYAKHAPMETAEIVDNLLATSDLSLIQDVASVKQVHDRINNLIENNAVGSKQFTVLMYAHVTSFDLDGFSRVLLIKCARCKTQLTDSVCQNQECPTNFENEPNDVDIAFDIKMDLMDHSGTLVGCKFGNQIAEKLLGYTAKQFANLSDDQKGILKWKFLMRRCKVYIAVSYVGGRNPVIITVLDLSIANPLEVAQRLTVY